LRDHRVFEQQFRARAKEIKKFRSDGNLIEIGCAYGFFLSIVKKDYQAYGFDIAEGPINYARNILRVDARCEDFLNAAIETNSADIIVMWDVIEHLVRPDLIIKKVAQTLRPGGYLFITTGDSGSILAQVRREKWRLIHPPTHLHYFNFKTISVLLKSYGLKPIEITHVGSRRSIRQISYSLLAHGKKHTPKIYEFIANSAIGDLSFTLNTYDIMLIVGQKREGP
jgi:SAM-dependent methyltransferase